MNVEYLATLDWMLIGLYFLVILVMAWWVAGRKKSTHESSEGYFLAGRNVGWFVVGAALFASNIGSEHLVGLAGTGFGSGVAVGQFEVLASLILLLLGWLFVPFYIKSGVFTMPEFLERRYSSGARWYLAVISIVGYVLTKISVTLYAGGIVYEVLVGGNFWTGALIIVLATGAYTVLGGLRAVLYTEMLQMFMLVGGAVLVTVIGLNELGGWGALRESVDASFWDMWLPASHPDFPWTGIFFGAPILGVWYWCTDQFIVQRVLSAHGIDQARRGTIFGGFLKILPLFIFVIPGVIALALSNSGRLEVAQADHALPELIRVLLPVGIRGLVVAGFLAALMSSLAAVFNSCSTLITWDIYRKLRPKASERQLVWARSPPSCWWSSASPGSRSCSTSRARCTSICRASRPTSRRPSPRSSSSASCGDESTPTAPWPPWPPASCSVSRGCCWSSGRASRAASCSGTRTSTSCTLRFCSSLSAPWCWWW
jgi:SSS family solute:Na+ symporter